MKDAPMIDANDIPLPPISAEAEARIEEHFADDCPEPLTPQVDQAA